MEQRYIEYTPEPDESTGNIAGWAYVQQLRSPAGDTHPAGPLYIPPNTYMINQVYTVPKYRGQGVGAAIMWRIVSDADYERANLLLDVDPGVDNYAPTKADHARLVRFYEQFGFVWDDAIGGMRREPGTDPQVQVSDA